jgi:hypothetical protein
MSDLIERLRDKTRLRAAHGLTGWVLAEEALLAEAADEIERLASLAWPEPPRPCTCHPDDNPPVPCTQQYALNECRAVHGEPTEAQIEAWQLLADLVAGLEATHWSSWQTTAHFDSALDAARAALAAKDNGNAGE